MRALSCSFFVLAIFANTIDSTTVAAMKTPLWSVHAAPERANGSRSSSVR
jgi:hypothetical protein